MALVSRHSLGLDMQEIALFIIMLFYYGVTHFTCKLGLTSVLIIDVSRKMQVKDE